MIAAKLWSVLPARMAMRLNSLSLQRSFRSGAATYRVRRRAAKAPRAADDGDDDLGAAVVQFRNDGIAVEGLVSDQSAKSQTIDQRSDADRIEAMAGQKNKAHEIAERVGQRQDFGRHAALGAADRLALIPPFAPCPWRWTLTIVASTMAYSMSGSSEQASNSLLKTPASTQSR